MNRVGCLGGTNLLLSRPLDQSPIGSLAVFRYLDPGTTAAEQATGARAQGLPHCWYLFAAELGQMTQTIDSRYLERVAREFPAPDRLPVGGLNLRDQPVRYDQEPGGVEGYSSDGSEG